MVPPPAQRVGDRMVAPPFLEAAGHSSTGEAIKFLSYVLEFLGESEQARKNRLGAATVPPAWSPGPDIPA